ncbi:MAG: hypothetical protein MK135_16325, partial [Polyangiaceae bacterium]|nr:hypothetical protein [Polyangiaceae bacterium]
MKDYFIQNALLGLCSSLLLAQGLACSETSPTRAPVGELPSGLDWASSPSFQTSELRAEPYTGELAPVAEAQRRLPTGSALHSEVVLRSCGPLGGVCHNRKEYPDLRSQASFLSVIGAECNVQSATPEGVFDGCERVGDRFDVDGSSLVEIAWIELIPGDPPESGEDGSPEMAGLHVHLSESISNDRNAFFSTGHFTRTFIREGEVEDLSYFALDLRWRHFDEGKHWVAEVPSYATDRVNSLLQVGVEQGDLNRNGIFGARPG